MKKEEAYTFIAKMDSKGRLRIPVQGREANGYKLGARFNVMILELEDKE